MIKLPRSQIFFIVLLSAGFVALVGLLVFSFNFQEIIDSKEKKRTPTTSLNRNPSQESLKQSIDLPNKINSAGKGIEREEKNEEENKISRYWKELRMEKLGFTLMIPPTWIVTSHFEPWGRPTDPVDPASYTIWNREGQSIEDWREDDVFIRIRKLRYLSRPPEKVIEEDSRIYNLTLVTTLTIDGLQAQTMVRDIKPGMGTERHQSFITYIEAQDGLYSIDATYWPPERFNQVNRKTIEAIVRSLKRF